ncbi:MAG: hypothetical protein GY714_02415 [Desulfobacterales bacterium]|nr:hypothetical protein [Desulfobacterales bacterium]
MTENNDKNDIKLSFEQRKITYNNIAKGIFLLYPLLVIYLVFIHKIPIIPIIHVSHLIYTIFVFFFLIPILETLIKDRFKHLGYDFVELKKEVEHLVVGMSDSRWSKFYPYALKINENIIKDKQAEFYITYLWLFKSFLINILFVITFVIFLFLGFP